MPTTTSKNTAICKQATTELTEALTSLLGKRRKQEIVQNPDVDVVYSIKSEIQGLVIILDMICCQTRKNAEDIILQKKINDLRILLIKLIYKSEIDLVQLRAIPDMVEIVAKCNYLLPKDKTSEDVEKLQAYPKKLRSLEGRIRYKYDQASTQQALLRSSYSGGAANPINPLRSALEQKSYSAPTIHRSRESNPKDVLSVSTVTVVNNPLVSQEVLKINSSSEQDFRQITKIDGELRSYINNQHDLYIVLKKCLNFANGSITKGYQAGANLWLNIMQEVLEYDEKLTYEKAENLTKIAENLCAETSTIDYGTATRRIKQIDVPADADSSAKIKPQQQ